MDTIAAVATAPGEGGIAIIRISGPESLEALKKCFRPRNGRELLPRMLTYGRVVDRDGYALDEAMAVYMPAPATYTREDVCEIQCHGGRGITRQVLDTVLETGLIRPAEPGEFTKRAFLSGRIDLSEAEAVMGLIQAGSQAATRAAARQLEGGVSRFVRRTRKSMEELLALVSAATDFPEEIDETVTAERVLIGARKIRREIEAHSNEKAARVTREGISIALTGKPNVGKSSFLNAAAGYDRAIVSDIPGTTRDVLTERVTYRGILMELSDTAGQRETESAIEAMGVERARDVEARADVVLLLLDASQPITAQDKELLSRMDERYMVVLNKADRPMAVSVQEIKGYGRPVWEASAIIGSGIGKILDAVYEACCAGAAREDGMVTARHVACARRAMESLNRLEETITSGNPLDLVVDDLWQAMYALSEITGENAAEDVIDAVFAHFCVGK